MSVRVVCWGTRGSIPAPGPDTTRFGGNTACVEVRAGDRLLILDAGTGLRALGRELARERDTIQADLLLTHFHMDHVQGLPFFEPLYREDVTLDIRASAPSSERLERDLMRPMGTIYLPIPRGAVAARLNFMPFDTREWSIGPVRVAVYPAQHPSGAVGFRLRSAGASLAYFPDNELGAADGDWYDGLVEFVGGVDLLLHDAVFTDSEYAGRGGWGHSTFRQAVRLAEGADVGELHFFHHAPERTDAELMAIVEALRADLAARGSGLRIRAAREGAEIVLPE